jgi:hypothetical protein
LIAGIALVCAGAAKWKRNVELRERIARFSREERVLRAEYLTTLRIRNPCGSQRAMAEALLRVADQRRHEIECCEREIRRIY